MTESGRIARPAVGFVRIAVGVVALLVIGYAYLETFPDGDTNPFNYFGYFTNLTGLATSLVLISMGVLTLTRRQALTLTVARATAVTCMIIVAVIYNGIVPGTGTAAPWVSVALHIVLPVFVVLDWVLVSDRPRLRWRWIWLILPYPLVWLAVVLVRGATDGWVPYGFLLPAHGATTLALTVAGLLAALLGAGVVTWSTNRLELASRLLAS